MKRITVSEIMAYKPCEDYTLERVTELWAGRESLTVREILELDITEEDRIWAATRPGILPSDLLVRFAWACAIQSARKVDAAEWAARAARPERACYWVNDPVATAEDFERQVKLLLAAPELQVIP